MDKKDFMEGICALINDEEYISNVTPDTSNTANRTDEKLWKQELEYSTKTYNASSFVTF